LWADYIRVLSELGLNESYCAFVGPTEMRFVPTKSRFDDLNMAPRGFQQVKTEPKINETS
jgi:hypothetical protein